MNQTTASRVSGTNVIKVLATGLLLSAVSLALPAKASIYTLSSPGTITPSSSTFPTGGTMLAQTSLPFVNNPLGTLNGTVTSTVYSGDPSNPYGGLTFTYLVMSSSSSIDDASELTVGGYNGFLTDVSYNPSPAFPTVAPTQFSRTGGIDDTLEIFWEGAGIQPGQTGALIVVQTSAHNFELGSGAVQDTIGADVSVYAPVPEPATSSLLISGLGAFFIFRNRRSK